MFNPTTAIFVVAIGVFVGYFLDGEKKNHDMQLLGIGILVFTPVMIGGKYGFNWGVAGLIEIIAGLGLYKMGLHQMFESSRVLGQQKEIESTNSETSSNKYSEDIPDPFVNFNKTQDKNQILTSEGNRINIIGVENGKSVEYYEDGSKLYEGSWINGKQEGTSFAYHKDGTKWIEMNHTAGVRDGIFTVWHSNGQIKSIENYINGKLEDKSVAWYPDGSVKYEEYYFNGELQKGSVYLDKNGKPTTKKEQQNLDDRYDDFYESLK
jgi:antitoxin component YwqK of YwqJK toxin-antitoxin module